MEENKVLSFEEEQSLFKKYSETKDADIREELICRNLNLVKKIANDYHLPGVDFDDLVSEGYIGLMTAVDKFDYRLGYRFCTYAYCWIKQAMLRYITNNSRTIRIPARVYDKLSAITKYAAAYERKNGYPPADAEIAKATGFTEDEVKNCLAASVPVVSLHQKTGDDDDSELGDFIADDNPTPDEEAELRDRNERLLKAVNTLLTPREKTVIVKRFGLYGTEPMTLSAVAEILDLSRERIRQIENEALKKLKTRFTYNNSRDGNTAA